MLILKPIFHRDIWGGNTFVPIYGEKAKGLAHLYSVYCKSDLSNTILNGEHKGKQLNKVLNFPLTIAIVDAAQDLSIQVHPSDQVAKKLEDIPIGKREAWYFIKKPKRGYIYNGVEKEFAFCKEVLPSVRRLEICDGDYVFVSPGTVHAMTEGSFVYEIEEGADITYRLFDYHRTDANGNERALHIEKAKTAIDRDARSVTKRYHTEPIVESTFTTCLKLNIGEYQNTSEIHESITLIGDMDLHIDGIHIFKGMSIIVEPYESVHFLGKQIDIIVAKVNV